ncbi:monovalent cation/H(+) antiporter subunit G [Lujinxingia vulgaris]|uniref:Monovalent cation/H(+) antiporter subunit G n=1 Tax=Lujinxingia vulgaris TaxID=2600176 RepID=A0A5C6XDC1_9DELT|nr:monovalent cation/H(+) antiporter subunit G [Lujinxingia vulgaris]TXD39371.1 monovalent cation/H(+) antiporter subunit G [Lujinxingia vulgaris]
MEGVRAVLALVLMMIGALFFVAGSVGMLRFPDVYTRLHALTKADNLGMGLVVLGLSLKAPGWQPVLKLVLTWIFVMIAGTVSCHLVAREAYRQGVKQEDGGEP